MRSTAWIAFFRRLPEKLQEGLSLNLTTGMEIILNRIVRLDEDFVIVKGRPSGTQDGFRVVIIPFNQIASVVVLKELNDVEVDEVFENSGESSGHEYSAPRQDETRPAVSMSNSSSSSENSKTSLPSKAALLAKLRARLGDK